MPPASEHPRAASPVRIDHSGIALDGTPTLLLCSSLFYFRIPRGLWRDRLRALRAAGYNCIDVYFPWNYHEPAEGAWDFAGERDVVAFLRLAAVEGLWVLARPGPYICSEWDGGGLPAYLLTKPILRLRDNDPVYLSYVARWFDRILPIIRAFQLGHGGTVIAVQLENELDFYACADPAGYMAALRDLALQRRIVVPLIACAGQGDLSSATGDAVGLLPTCNFYPDDRDPSIEELVTAYYATLRERGVPLCVTETNRAHLTLRRLLSCGAKWIGPYLQVSGSNAGFTNAINNWGAPLALLASDYDLGGMIGAQGQLRAEVAEARLLSMLIAALGAALTLARPCTDHGLVVQGEIAPVEGGPRALALYGGGLALALPNLDDAPRQLRLRHGTTLLPVYTNCTVAAGRCPFLLLDLPLAAWRIAGTLAYTTAELCMAQAYGHGALLVFHAESAAEVALVFALPPMVQAQAIGVFQQANRVTLCFDGLHAARATIQLADGATLRIVMLDRGRAARLLDLAPDGSLRFARDPAAARDHPAPAMAWLAAQVDTAGVELGGAAQPLDGAPRYLEHAGIVRGFAWYRASLELPDTAQPRGLLLHNASDIMSVYWAGAYQGTVAPGGGGAYLAAHNSNGGDSRQLLVRAEIWGHSNFDDPRLPALRLNALKGLSGITAVLRERRLNPNWRWYPGASNNALTLEGRRHAAIVGWGRWMSTDQPESGCYVKRVPLAADADAWILYFAGLQALVRVAVDGHDFGVINPLDPYVDISDAVRPGQAATIALYIERWQRQPAGDVVLLEGRRATRWSVSGGAEQALWAALERRLPRARATELPYRLEPGQLGWLIADVSELAALGGCWIASCAGHNVKVTALLGGRVVGRLWLPGTSGRPAIVGGDPSVAYLPEPWLDGASVRLALLVEAVERDAPGELSEVGFRPAG
jgi:beta-galactosidase